MHHTTQHPLLRVILRGRNFLEPNLPAFGVTTRVCAVLQGQENVAVRILVKSFARNPLHQLAQHNKINVAVGKLRARWILQRLGLFIR